MSAKPKLYSGSGESEPLSVLPVAEMHTVGDVQRRYEALWTLRLAIWVWLGQIAAVKFGRMSKKQREKVEEEVSFHRMNNLRNAQAAAAAAQSNNSNHDQMPDSTLFDMHQPTSSTPISG